MQKITTFTLLPCSRQSVVLEGTTDQVRLTWRGYCQAWYLDLLTAAGDAILTGVRIEEGADLLLCADSDLAPPGKLLAVQTGPIGAAAAASTVVCRLTGAATTARAGHTFLDADGRRWTPAADVILPLAGTIRDGVFRSVEPGPFALAVGAVLTPEVPATAGLTCTVSTAAVPGSYGDQPAREDLEVGLLLVYVTAAEVAALAAA